MPSSKTLNVKNLAALGAERLAELLIEISSGNPAAKRRLRLELAGVQSPGEVAREVRKRLTTIARSRSFVDWQNRRALVDDLETQRRAIADQVAKADPAEALDLTWRFLAVANPVLDRCDDSSGTVVGVFHAACNDLGEIAKMAKADPKRLAEQACRALTEGDYGQYDNLIERLAPALGAIGLEHLKRLVLQLSREPPPKPDPKDRKVIGWGDGGPLYADQLSKLRRDGTVRLALEAIADAQGDVDGFIAQQSEKARRVPRVAVEIARRLLGAGRAKDAWEAINAVDLDQRESIPLEWEEARLDVMEALGRAQEAQAFRWQCFERSLSTSHLRAYLKRLPEFDDQEAEHRALSFAMTYPEVHQALAFLVSWPASDKAAALVLARSSELDGNIYEILSPAAEALADKQPLAATALLRAMIDFSLTESRSSRYRHAARHLTECDRLALGISDFEPLEPHDAYVARLRAEHGRKSGFWSLT